MNNKICTKCHKRKKIIEFALNKNNPSGLSSHCKKCKIIYAKKSALDNKEKIKIYQKKYRKEHKEQAKKYMKKYYIKNKHKLIRKSRTYYSQIKNQFTLKRKLYKNLHLKNNIQFKIKENLRKRITNAIKGNIKSLHTMFLIGCEIDYLMYYLQSQFKSDMSWSNYGKWHIDHIKPCASFDLSKPKEQRKCFHYTNLQPLWAGENIRKGKKLIG